MKNLGQYYRDKDFDNFFKYTSMYLSFCIDDEIEEYIISRVNELENYKKYHYLKYLILSKEQVNLYLDDYFDLEFAIEFNGTLSVKNLIELDLHVNFQKGECEKCHDFTRILDYCICINCFDK